MMKTQIITIKNKQPAKQGDYYIFSIPNQYIKDGSIKADKHYTLIIEEVEEAH